MVSQTAHNFMFAAILAAAICLSVLDDARAEMADDPFLAMIMLDQMETRDVAAENPERTARFREEILAWIQEMKQPFH